jgi:hypothetical protein
MYVTLTLAVLFSLYLQQNEQCQAFQVLPLQHAPRLSNERQHHQQRLQFSSSSSSSSSDPSFQQSRLFGNQREPTIEEIQIMDEMIYKLANAKPYDLPLSVQRAYRVISSPRFFVRIAELVDQYMDDSNEEKMKLITLADNLVSTLDAIVSTAQDKLQEYTVDVENVLKAAAEPDTGEFLVPLSRDRMDAMRSAMNQLDTSILDGDTFLLTVDAFMNKSHKDGLDLMVTILQNVLQLYAGRRILETRRRIRQKQNDRTTTTASIETNNLFDQLLQTDADQWDSTIRNGIVYTPSEIEDNNHTTTIMNELILEIQRYMESIILSFESGSMTQRVQAEYLQELIKRIEFIQQQSQKT